MASLPRPIDAAVRLRTCWQMRAYRAAISARCALHYYFLRSFTAVRLMSFISDILFHLAMPQRIRCASYDDAALARRRRRRRHDRGHNRPPHYRASCFRWSAAPADHGADGTIERQARLYRFLATQATQPSRPSPSVFVATTAGLCATALKISGCAAAELRPISRYSPLTDFLYDARRAAAISQLHILPPKSPRCLIRHAFLARPR